MKEFGFPSSEKLKAKKDIDRLFKEGKWITTGNLRIIWLASESETKVGVSVSKRYFKKAVHRNRVKRLLREAYRLNKLFCMKDSENTFTLCYFGHLHNFLKIWISKIFLRETLS